MAPERPSARHTCILRIWRVPKNASANILAYIKLAEVGEASVHRPYILSIGTGTVITEIFPS